MASHAPVALRGSDVCGPLAAWMALRHFGRRVQSRRLIELCRWRQGHGAHAIGLAVALAEYGLSVQFQSDLDPDPQPIELECYDRARQLGVRCEGAREVSALLQTIRSGAVPILLYDGSGDDAFGHFAVLRGEQCGYAVLSDPGSWYAIANLETRRAAPGVLRQSIVVRSD
jgi:hypothetical protein